ncbi:MAG: SPW repeat protein [Gammaproteobacteria bacterium]|nr:SPW repeat protein [Gammaproteobacteria bacterium]
MHNGRWQDWANLVLGAWLIIAPFALGYAEQSGVGHDHADARAQALLNQT